MKSSLRVHFSSATDDWATPQAFFDKMNAKWGPFDLDVCASEANAKCARYFSLEVDGLAQDWAIHKRFSEMHRTRCWMNPPYGRGIAAWVEKAYRHSLRGCLVVCLLPARTDTKWFHEYCTKGEIEFIKGRLKFGNAKNAAPFPSMVVVFRLKGGK